MTISFTILKVSCPNQCIASTIGILSIWFFAMIIELAYTTNKVSKQIINVFFIDISSKNRIILHCHSWLDPKSR